MRSYLRLGFCLSTVILIFGACKKELPPVESNSALTIVNASLGNPSIIATFSDSMLPYYLNVGPISYGSYTEYGVPSGKTPLILVSSADTTKPLFQQMLTMQTGGIYTLYITGQGHGGQGDALLLRDTLPFHTDSIAGIRFINLSPDSGPVSINLQGNFPSSLEFSNLNYKEITSFKNYAAANGVQNYNFEIRDQVSGNLLTTFSWGFNVFKNNTVVISGSANPTYNTPIGAFQVNNY